MYLQSGGISQCQGLVVLVVQVLRQRVVRCCAEKSKFHLERCCVYLQSDGISQCRGLVVLVARVLRQGVAHCCAESM